MDTAAQALTFLRCVGLGAALGLGYDVLRALRRSLGWRWLAFLLDLLFWAAATVLLFTAALAWEAGRVRLYLGCALLLGGGTYLLSLSRLVLPALLAACAWVGRLTLWLLRPARRLGRGTKKFFKNID